MERDPLSCPPVRRHLHANEQGGHCQSLDSREGGDAAAARVGVVGDVAVARRAVMRRGLHFVQLLLDSAMPWPGAGIRTDGAAHPSAIPRERTTQRRAEPKKPIHRSGTCMSHDRTSSAATPNEVHAIFPLCSTFALENEIPHDERCS